MVQRTPSKYVLALNEKLKLWIRYFYAQNDTSGIPASTCGYEGVLFFTKKFKNLPCSNLSSGNLTRNIA